MASTNTSRSITLELFDTDTGASIRVPAFDPKKSTVRNDVYLNGIVVEEHIYRLMLLTENSIEADVIEISVNGGDSMRADISATYHDKGSDSTSPSQYEVIIKGRTNRTGAKEHEKLFFHTYGFARIELRIPNFGDFITADIPCSCIEKVNAQDVRTMLEALLDNEDQTVTDWMFSYDKGSDDSYALLESSTRQGRSKSLISFIRLAQETLGSYETWLAYFRSSGHCIIKSDSKRVSGFDVRKLGTDEFVWLMRNGDVLSEVQADTGLAYSGRNYFPRFLVTEVKSKSYDNYENRVVLSFLADVIASLKRVESGVREGVERLQSRISRIDSLRGDQNLPGLVVMEECISREISLIDHLDSQRKRAQRLFAQYRNALPGVREQRGIAQNPRRTKIFQEVHAYSAIYLEIDRWRKFGEFSLARENLALHALRLDKLYEYYALYMLLRAFRRNGYVPDDAFAEAYKRVKYRLDAPKYSNEKTVNNLYRFRGPKGRITLYYEPVIYGDAREDHGIAFHKKSPRLPFAPIVLDSYYLPDFMLVYECENLRKTFVLDAKYSTSKILTDSRNNDWCVFNETYFKYVADMADESLKTIDALWILAGREDIPGIKAFEIGSWIASRTDYIPSGIAPASPTIDSLDKLFIVLGLIEDGASLVDEEVVDNEDEGATHDSENDKDVRDTVDDVPDTDGRPMVEIEGEGKDSQDAALIHSEADTGLGAKKTAVINLVERLLYVHVTNSDLRNQRWCVKSFGVNSPIIRDKKPKRRFESRRYSRQKLSIGEVYVLTEWRQDQLNMLNRFLVLHEKKDAQQS